ncbi:hypothetical protein MBANPS3_012454 [Mucor bainieri]
MEDNQVEGESITVFLWNPGREHYPLRVVARTPYNCRAEYYATADGLFNSELTDNVKLS